MKRKITSKQYVISEDDIQCILEIVQAWEMRACDCDIMYGWHCGFHASIQVDLKKIKQILKGEKQDG